MKSKGFTLIELLVVIGILAILATVVLVAISPGRQMAQARNSERWAEVNTLLNAIGQYQVDNAGLPACIATTTKCIGTGGACCDLSTDLVPTYVAAIPEDSKTGSAADTGYDVSTSGPPSYRVIISAPDAELGLTISVSR